MKIAISIISALFVLFLNSCKKPDESKVPVPGIREMLTSKDWLIIKSQSGSHTTTIEDSDCNNDVRWVFTNAGKFSQLEGCGQDVDISGDWTINDKVITITESNSDQTVFTIKSIVPSSLELDYDETTITLRPL